ncbi:hypothetical protein [Nocardioides acrostichi]|uniref:Uncharacterized protein n=1 Tax=Nocardioides acrostichi TaxID=2784339 RepID=A0A930V4E6_9ACTN|nr:hypothetical protein [Nocardioides acrostichi]MBF4163799.1 hypothetical protein [Nocardioides acrostichi]
MQQSSSGRATATFPAVVFVATFAGLLAAVLVPTEATRGQFVDKGWAIRLGAYPTLMLLPVIVWWLATRRAGARARAPWTAFGLVMLPFASDVAGNWLDLFRRVSWWDDASHAVHWFLLLLGLGLLVADRVRPRWVLVPLVTGSGCLLALLWELGEYLLFIQHGKEAGGAYRDTLGDLTLGTGGALLAGLLLGWGTYRRST